MQNIQFLSNFQVWHGAYMAFYLALLLVHWLLLIWHWRGCLSQFVYIMMFSSKDLYKLGLYPFLFDVKIKRIVNEIWSSTHPTYGWRPKHIYPQFFLNLIYNHAIYWVMMIIQNKFWSYLRSADKLADYIKREPFFRVLLLQVSKFLYCKCWNY